MTDSAMTQALRGVNYAPICLPEHILVMCCTSPEPTPRRAMSKARFIAGLAVCSLLVSSMGNAANAWGLNLSEDDIRETNDAVLTLMAFTVLPDVTTSSLSISRDSTSNPGLWQSTLGGGFTLSESFPLYLEGNLGYSRYDPKFIISNGQEQRSVPVKWNSFVATGGVGWDFPLTEDNELKLRPIFSFTLGHVTTDASIAQDIANEALDTNLDLIDDGKMNAYGLGGAMMLVYERYREDYEIDLEMRYSIMQLNSFGGTTEGLEGHSETNTASVWARWRAPTGTSYLQRPLRYVLEASHTAFFGPQRGALGFNDLSSIGAGIELDTSAYPVVVTRTRLVGRYIFGQNVNGFSLGLAVSF